MIAQQPAEVRQQRARCVNKKWWKMKLLSDTRPIFEGEIKFLRAPTTFPFIHHRRCEFPAYAHVKLTKRGDRKNLMQQ
jgi:hypothetical protein